MPYPRHHNLFRYILQYRMAAHELSNIGRSSVHIT